jgi:hypothetical protein
MCVVLAYRHWTEAFAMPKTEDEKVTRLVAMGFEQKAVEQALKASGMLYNSKLVAVCSCFQCGTLQLDHLAVTRA